MAKQTSKRGCVFFRFFVCVSCGVLSTAFHLRLTILTPRAQRAGHGQPEAQLDRRRRQLARGLGGRPGGPRRAPHRLGVRVGVRVRVQDWGAAPPA